MDIGDFFEESQEGSPITSSVKVPPSIDFGAPISLDDIISGAVQIPKVKPKKKAAPASFDFEIPVPPLKTEPALPAVQIDSSELELVLEEDENVGATHNEPSIDLSEFLEIDDGTSDTSEDEDILDLGLDVDVDASTSGEALQQFDLDLSSSETQGAPGAMWLMKIASEKRSGRLRVPEGPAKGVIYFASGEGVWGI